MTSPDHDPPTTPGWTSPTSPPPAAGAQPDQPAAPPVPAAPGYAQPAYGQAGYAQPGYAQPGYGPPGSAPAQPAAPAYQAAPGYPSSPGYGPPAGYRPPPPQPGIIPLRPLGLGEILDGAFRAIRANPRVMFVLTALVVTVTVALQTAFQWYVGGLLAGSAQDLTSSIDPGGELGLADTVAPAAAQLLTLPGLTLATTVLTGLLIVAVSRAVLGQTVTVAEVWGRYRGRVGLVLVFTVVLAVATILVLGALVGLVVLAATNGLTGVAVVLGLFGGLAFVLGYFWVLVRTLLIPAAIMLEGAGLRSAVRRGWNLSRGTFWRLLGIYLLTSVIVNVVNALIVTPANLIARFAFQDPLTSSFGSLVVLGIGNIIALTLTTVFTAAVVALLYIDVRMRREGLDVELARAAGATAA
jgi:hypothetical protein